MAYLDDNKRQVLLNYITPRLTPSRLLHTLGTEKMAIALAKSCQADICAAQTAALLHDAFKCIPLQEKRLLASKYNIETVGIHSPDLLHGPIAAEAVKIDLGIADEDILNAIRYHTTGRAGMSTLEKIIYTADVIEENRTYDGVEALRRVALQDIHEGTFIVMREVLYYLLRTEVPIVERTVTAYNQLLNEHIAKENHRGKEL